jgi:pyruvate/2-oxoglutarate/acetoin dehydrogenase E1 component
MPEPPRYVEALNHALADELERDPAVIVTGVDVGAAGGVYGVTKGLQERFGAARVRDTPIAEAGVVGAAVGAAMAGLRPVVEIMYMDFISVCLDPIVNQAAKLRYMTGGGVTVPIVFRTQTGGGRSAGAQHSQSLEGMLAHVPGLKVFCPGDARDAYDLLVEAIRDDSPVCFVENRRLYPRRAEDWDRPPLPAGRPRVVRPGSGVTVVAWGRMVSETLRALGHLADGPGSDAEVIDLRTLAPLDLGPVVESVARTGRCLVVHEATRTSGFGAELAALVQERCFTSLEAPILRITGWDTPFPYTLENDYLPLAPRILEGVRGLSAYLP